MEQPYGQEQCLTLTAASTVINRTYVFRFLFEAAVYPFFFLSLFLFLFCFLSFLPPFLRYVASVTWRMTKGWLMTLTDLTLVVSNVEKAGYRQRRVYVHGSNGPEATGLRTFLGFTEDERMQIGVNIHRPLSRSGGLGGGCFMVCSRRIVFPAHNLLHDMLITYTDNH